MSRFLHVMFPVRSEELGSAIAINQNHLVIVQYSRPRGNFGGLSEEVIENVGFLTEIGLAECRLIVAKVIVRVFICVQPARFPLRRASCKINCLSDSPSSKRVLSSEPLGSYELTENSAPQNQLVLSATA